MNASLSASQELRVIAATEAADMLAVRGGRYAHRQPTAAEVIELATWLLGTGVIVSKPDVTVNVTTEAERESTRRALADAIARTQAGRRPGMTL